MITAKEARERIEALKTERVNREKETVEAKINTAVEAGFSSCWLDTRISESTEKWLISLGYNVQRMNSPNHGSEVFVSWW